VADVKEKVMKRSLGRFEDAARRAREAPAPPVDVTARVVARLRATGRREPPDKTLAWCSAVALAASVVFAAWGYDAWSMLSDPLVGLVCQTEVVLE
jgi:hypothetical protein